MGQRTESCKLVERPYLNRILICKEVNDLERMCDDADSQELLAIVATLHHQTKRIYSEALRSHWCI